MLGKVHGAPPRAEDEHSLGAKRAEMLACYEWDEEGM